MNLRSEKEQTIINDLDRLKLLTYKVQEHRLEKAWRRFEEAGFKPLLIKGWAAAQFYPNPADRFYNDIDLIVNPSELEKAEELIKSFKENTAIDLHRGARHLDKLSYQDLYDNSITLKCGETFVRVLRPEDHLRILCVHWLNDGGAKRDKLWDIYYVIANRPKNFDWDRCLNTVGRKRRDWIICTIGLAQKYLALDLKDTPFADKQINIPRWLIKALEKEWRSETVLIPLHFCLNDSKKLIEQIKKRIPPNAIQATVELDGEFDSKPRFIYQCGDVLFRMLPSVKRIFRQTFKEE